MASSDAQKAVISKAIALRYDRVLDRAPKVVATGKGELAEHILKCAAENGVAIHRDRELADILALLELDEVIPIEAYVAIAEIFSYLYRLNASLKREGV